MRTQHNTRKRFMQVEKQTRGEKFPLFFEEPVNRRPQFGDLAGQRAHLFRLRFGRMLGHLPIAQVKRLARRLNVIFNLFQHKFTRDSRSFLTHAFHYDFSVAAGLTFPPKS
jgi:hypothetical protein